MFLLVQRLRKYLRCSQLMKCHFHKYLTRIMWGKHVEDISHVSVAGGWHAYCSLGILGYRILEKKHVVSYSSTFLFQMIKKPGVLNAKSNIVPAGKASFVYVIHMPVAKRLSYDKTQHSCWERIQFDHGNGCNYLIRGTAEGKHLGFILNKNICLNSVFLIIGQECFLK